jgi:serine/threonine protein kinase/GMP synthase-like glutamine amidotransferase
MGIEQLHAVWPEWKVTEQIGQGAFGKVYKVVREEYGVTSYAAVKVISIPQNEAEVNALRADGYDETASRTYLESVITDFVGEIKLMLSMKGTANIVGVEDYKVVKKTGQIGWDIFIRMELLTSFTNYAAGKTLTEAEVVKLGVDICSALELCAQKNIIHRDIKPENIFISPFGDFKVGDFGIARELEKTGGAMSSKGTYSYAAPEVVSSKPYGAAADIYSLGLVLYKLLNNNRLPFIDPNSQQILYQDRTNAVNRRLSGEPLPAPAGASRQLAQVILQACAFDPAMRFKTATAFKAALAAALEAAKTPAQAARPPVQPAPPHRPPPVYSPHHHSPKPPVKSNSGLKIVLFSLLGVFLVIGTAVGIIFAVTSGNTSTEDRSMESPAPETTRRPTQPPSPTPEPETTRQPTQPPTPAPEPTPSVIYIETPKIVITTRYDTRNRRFAPRDDVVSSVFAAGGIPVFPDNDTMLADAIQNGNANNADIIAGLYDGLILTGGGDISARFFGQERHWASGDPDENCDIAEIALCRAFIRAGKPVFGINRGMQVINVAMGGDIIQDIPDLLGISSNVHSGNNSHTIQIEPGTWLHNLFGSSLTVDSWHHQAIGRLADNLTVAARVGVVIEAIEYGNIIGVQFNPARMPNADMLSIYNDFIHRCSYYSTG